MDLAQLKEPFAEKDLEWRVQSAGKKGDRIWARVLCYVTARAIMDRLDEVCGPENWRDDYREGPAGGVLAGIAIRIDGEWVWKWDGAENTDIEAVKGGLSGALKRAAVKWGVGRYLYRLGESFANVHDGGQFRGLLKDKTPFRWDPPPVPEWALPKDQGASADQLRTIEELMRSRTVAPRQLNSLQKRLADGLSAKDADEAITWLSSLPKAA